MNTFIYENKLSKPHLPHNWIKRNKILKLLDKSVNSDVIQVVAPAGSGKSMLISHWISERNYPYLWYSLNLSDNDLNNFYSYLLRGLVINKIISEEAYLGVLKMFNTSEYNMNAFISSQLLSIENDLYLIFDDFHFISCNEIFTFLKKLLDLKNQYLKIIVISREECPFPPISKTLEGSVTQIGTSELSLSKKEIQSYLKMLSSRGVNSQLIESIYEKTEGWLIGVQLMSLFAVKGELVPKELNIKKTTSIKQYMIDEILLLEDQSIIDFVYKTSVVDYFTTSLCEKIMDDTKLNVESILYRLMKKNLFLVELEKENTYRYHHLFKEALDLTRQQYFKSNSLVNEKSINLIIASWYEQNDMSLEAIDQYIQVKEYSKAVNLLSKIWPEIDIKMLHKNWKQQVDKLPEDSYMNNPIICLGLGWTLLQDGYVSLAQSYFKKSFDVYIQKRYSEHQEVSNTIPLSCKISEVYIASINKQYDGILDKIKNIFNEFDTINVQNKGILYTLQACAYWAKGDFYSAEQSLVKSREYLKDDLVFNLVDLTLIELYCEFGYFKKAELLLNLVESRVGKNNVLKITKASIELFRGKLYFYKGDLELAYEKLSLSEEYGSIFALDDWYFKMLKFKARMLISQEMFDEAYEIVAQLRMVINPSPVPEYITLSNLEDTIRLRQTKEMESISNRFSKDNDAYFTAEYSNILFILTTLYSVKRNNSDGSNLDYMIETMKDLVKTCERQKRINSLVTFNLLLSICYHYKGDEFKSREYYAISEKITAQEGYKLPYMLFSKENIIENIPISKGGLVYSISNKELIEPLSKRELDILLCICEGLTNKEISNKLYLSEETIKSYNKSIFRKLEVNRRTQVIVKAKELGFIK
ncbi:MAG: LuxR C-terminal-related transcriptional regulator [Clostridiales bacterium]|nr:LuxR C-terminal-related transcriptional regulator [Clostridiales bacterium]